MKFSQLKKKVDSSGFTSQQLGGNVPQHLEKILEIVNKINSTLVLEDVLELVLKSAIDFTYSERGFIVLLNNNEELEYKVGLNSEGQKIRKNDFYVSKSVIEDVFSSGESRFVESAQSDNKFDKSQSIFKLELQTILCSPLITGKKKIGVIYVDSKNLNRIKDKSVTDTFEILAGQAATAIKNAQLYNGQIEAYKELQKTNRELQVAKENAEKSDRLKSEFLAQMSHEIRTPIHIMLSNTELIKEELGEDVSSELNYSFNSIRMAGHRMIRTTDLIINMSEIHAKTYKPMPSRFFLGKEVLLPLYSEYSIFAKEKGLEFIFEFDSVDPELFTDRYSVFQIFSNLLDNAIKYTNKGKVVIIVGKDEKNRTKVELRDTGIGISKEYLPHIFKPFSQEDQGYSRKYEGNGLGLALVREYCRINKFDLNIESKKGEGTSISVVL
ncbi:MAG: GAF domain-containing sensor histidine kinase [Melioribacteraceae bacterium]|nr:GAF domain-containing sensor histidine kinase [Melioribacteraceae bacterium]